MRPTYARIVDTHALDRRTSAISIHVVVSLSPLPLSLHRSRHWSRYAGYTDCASGSFRPYAVLKQSAEHHFSSPGAELFLVRSETTPKVRAVDIGDDLDDLRNGRGEWIFRNWRGYWECGRWMYCW